MAQSGDGGPHDHPGDYRLIPLIGTLDSITLALNQAETDGFEWVGANNDYVFLYKSEKK